MLRTTRILVASVLIAAAATPQATFPVFVDRWQVQDLSALEWASFVSSVDQFNRKLGGCPPKVPPPYSCSPTLGEFDARLWKNLKEQAKRVFK